MTFVGLTLLHVHEDQRDEWRDAIDARWTNFLMGCGLEPLYLPNRPDAARALLQRVRPAGIVLTGGGECAALSGKVHLRDEVESIAIDWAQRVGKPVLGVCRGMQVLLARAGATLVRVEGHVAREHPINVFGVRRMVNSYHGHAALVVPAEFTVEATSDDGVIEAVSNPERRWSGLMWHPERNEKPDPSDVRLFCTLFAREP